MRAGPRWRPEAERGSRRRWSGGIGKRYQEGGLERALCDAPRPGQKPLLDAEQGQRIIAMACGPPPDCRKPESRVFFSSIASAASTPPIRPANAQRRSLWVRAPSCAALALRVKRARECGSLGELCHGLWHNPAIPARVGSSLGVSLGHTQKTVSVRETPMNTAFPCRFVSLGSLPYRCTRRFDTVRGHVPDNPRQERCQNQLSRWAEFST
jgi:hypothetical protein